jgi:beta-lactamase superfamily II metal-dependent hydrolase
MCKHSETRLFSGLARAFLALSVSVALVSCGGGGTEPDPKDPPEITVAGVSDGDVLEGPVTILLTITTGATYQATLNGQPFFSGNTVSQAGNYTLEILARKDGLTSTVTISFEIRPVGGNLLILRFFNLGKNDAGGGGDAILLTDSSSMGQFHALIDAGPAGEGGLDTDYVLGRLRSLDVDTIQAMILSHAHSDHFDGMRDILNQLHVRDFYYNGQTRNFFRYQQTIGLAGTRAESRITVTQEETVSLGASGATNLRIIPPLADYLDNADANSSELNNGSLGTLLTRGDFSMFFAGDGEVEANGRWRESFGDLTSNLDVLKVGHHGANDAVFDNGSFGRSRWLEHTDPQVHVISGNGTSHPRVRSLQYLLGRAGTETYCTNVHGDIELRVDEDGDFMVTVERNASQNCEPGADATT